MTGGRGRQRRGIADVADRPNRLARSFAAQRAQTAALIFPEIANPFYPVLARSVQCLLRRDGYQPIICNTVGSRAEERSFLADAVDRRMDGVIFVSLASRSADVMPVTEATIPLVLLTAETEGARVASRSPTTDLVHSDDQRGMGEATRYLLAAGHQCIGFVNGVSEGGPAPRRLAGVRQAMDEAGIAPEPELVVATSFTRVGGVERVRRLLALADSPSAVLCANDVIAIGVLDVTHTSGLAVLGQPCCGRVRRLRGGVHGVPPVDDRATAARPDDGAVRQRGPGSRGREPSGQTEERRIDPSSVQVAASHRCRAPTGTPHRNATHLLAPRQRTQR